MTTFTVTGRRMALVAAFVLLLGALAVLSTRTTPPVEAANGFPIYLDCTAERTADGDVVISKLWALKPDVFMGDPTGYTKVVRSDRLTPHSTQWRWRKRQFQSIRRA